ncbi:MAG: PAS domain S-box protein [Candidatus Marinimicrobia bacterium]|nr:PAS domain S-box protein [Candidatus Neomarinimicrobiota bacterium]
MTKILIIDDIEDILISVKALLKNLEPGYEVLTAQSGIEGIKLAKSKQPDTILLDVHMPGMDGYEVCKRLRMEEKTEHIPIIFLTGVKTTSKDRINGLELGGDAYLTKPIDEEMLLAHLHAMIRIKKAEDKVRQERDLLEVKVADRTKELQVSEAKYIDLYENAPDMFASVDAKTSTILRCNQTLVLALGYKKDEIIGQPVFFVYHPDCMEEAKKNFQQFVDSGEIHGAELQLKRKDGSKIDVSLNVSSVRDEEGKVLYSRLIWRDITQRKRVEEEFRTQSAQRHRLLEAGRQLISSLEIDKVLKYVSEEVRTLLGCNGVTIYILDEQGKMLEPILAYDPPYEKQIMSAKLDIDNSLTGQGIKAKKGIIFNYATQQPGGYHIPGTPVDDVDHIITAPFIIGERTIGALTIYRRQEIFNEEDLTLVETFTMYASTAINNAQVHQELLNQIEKRERVEETLKASTTILEESQRIANLGSFVLDITTGIWTSSGILDKVFGIDKDYKRDVSGWVEIVHPDERKEMQDYLTNHVIAERKPFDKEYRIIRKNDQKECWVHGLGKLEFDSVGKPIRVIGVIQDITERKQAEERLKESERKFRNLFEESLDAVFISTLDDRILDMNKAGNELFGYTVDEFKKLNPEILYANKKDRESFLRKIKKQGFVKNLELKLQKKDGTIIYCLESSIGIRDANGNLIGYQGIIRDITKRKQAEEKLRNSERRYKHLFDELEAIFDLLPALIFYKDTENRLIRVNKYVADAYEMTKNELEGVNLFDLHTKDQAQAYWDDDLKVINSGKPKLDIDEPWETAEGLKWVNTSKIPFVDENGDIIGIIGISLDITERKKTEEELQASREYAQNLINSSLDMIIAVDKGRKIMEFNKAAEQTFGYKKEEVMGKHVELLYADVREGRTVHKSTVEKGKHVQEITNKRKNGETFPALLAASTLLNAQGEIVGIMGVSRDISEQKAAVQALRESEEKFRGVIEQSNDGIYVLQGDRFVFINPRFTEITGYELEEISGEDFDFMKLVAEEGLKVLEERKAMREKGEEPPGRYVFKGLRKDDQERDFEVSITLAEWGGEEATLGIIQDVTQRIQARMDLEDALEKAKQGEKVKSLFLANMSHEIRTPLNVILGFTDLIELSTKDKISSEEQNFFDTIRQSGKRLLHTIHEILDMSLIEAKTISVNLEELNLADIVKKAVKPLVSEANTKGLELNINTGESSGHILADEDSVVKTITNVVENAIKYTEIGRIDVDLTEKINTMVLSIKDTGIGIEKEFLDEIFQVFTQESEGYTKKYQGVGLGLALVKKYLEFCNASIEVKSKKGVGSTFTITFKKIKERSKKKRIEKSVEKTKVELDVRKHRPLVLLVEDDKSSQKLIHFFLKDYYELDFAVSVSEAKEKLREKKVELVLLDLSLIGGEDGLNLARYMRKTRKWQEIPIIATTAHAFMEDRDKCLNAGCNDYISKPMKQIDLLIKMEQWLQNRFDYSPTKNGGAISKS